MYDIDCYFSSLIYLFNSYKLNDEVDALWLSAWGLDNNRNNEIKYYTPQYIDVVDACNSFVHIEKLYRLNKTTMSKENIIDEIKKNNSVIFTVDSYYCYWCSTYKKCHSTHFINFKAFNDMKIIIYDAFYNRNITLSFDEFFCLLKKISVYKYKKNIKEIEYKDIMNLLLTNFREPNDIIKQYYNLIRLFDRVKILNDLYICEEIEANPIIVSTSQLYKNREKISKTLNIYNVDKDIIINLEKSALLLKKVNLLLIKMFYNKNILIIKRIVNLLQEAKFYELQAFDRIKDQIK